MEVGASLILSFIRIVLGRLDNLANAGEELEGKTAGELKNKEAEDDEAELDREEDAVEEDDEEVDDEEEDNDEVPASPQMLPMSSSPCTRFTATLISASVSPNM